IVSVLAPRTAVAAKRTLPMPGFGAAASVARQLPAIWAPHAPDTRKSAKSPAASVASSRRPLAVGDVGHALQPPASPKRSAVRSPTNDSERVCDADESRFATNRQGRPSPATNVPSVARPVTADTSESAANAVPPVGVPP